MNELPRGIDTAEARASETGCPARIYPLRRPEGHTPPIPRYSAVLPQQDKVAVLYMGVQSIDAAGLREVPLGDLLKTGGDLAPANADEATFTDPQGCLNRVAALYWLKAADFAAWSKLPEVAEWRERSAKLSSVGLWWEPVAVDANYMETIAFKEYPRGFSGSARLAFRAPKARAIGARRAIAFPPRPMICSRARTSLPSRKRAPQRFLTARSSRRRTCA
jgi:hypothetical protein